MGGIIENVLNVSQEALQRLINTERKLDGLIASQPASSGVGHPDQYFGGRTYSQHGEDMIVIAAFHAFGIARPSYLDIGAHHPLNISNTALLYERGARGVNIEPNPNLFMAFPKNRSEDINLNIGIAPVAGELPFYMIDEFSGRNTFDKEVAESFVREHPEFKIRDVVNIKVETINHIVEKYCDGLFPDFLTIDVEGLDLAILRSANFETSKPKLICVEVENSTGAGSSSPICEYLSGAGYVCIFKAVSNYIFVDKNYVGYVMPCLPKSR